jgi:hypothetical protein
VPCLVGDSFDESGGEFRGMIFSTIAVLMLVVLVVRNAALGRMDLVPYFAGVPLSSQMSRTVHSSCRGLRGLGKRTN